MPFFQRLALLGTIASVWSSSTEPASKLTCDAKKSAPSQPKHALKFCHIFPDSNCCLPAQDAETEEHYFNLLDAGDICAKESSMAKDALKLVFCAACSPRQPEYIKEIDNQKYFRMCTGLAEKVQPKEFDHCGMVRVEERGSPCKGDDVVIPSDQWPNVTTPPQGAKVTECSAQDGSSLAHTDYKICSSEHAFITDQSGAYPPFLPDETKIQLVKCVDGASDNVETNEKGDTLSYKACSEICYTGAASRATLAAATVLFSLFSLFIPLAW